MIRKTFEIISNYYARKGNIKKAHEIEDLGREIQEWLSKNKWTLIEAIVFLSVMIFFFFFGIVILEVLLYDVLKILP